MKQQSLAQPNVVSDRFSPDVRGILLELYGTAAPTILDVLQQPVKKYFIRCNTNKAAPAYLLKRFRAKALGVQQHPTISEAISITLEGPFEVAQFPTKVVVDKRTAEAVLQGANVYAPGVIDCGAMRPGQEVSVLTEFETLLASGTANMNSGEVLGVRRGLAVRVNQRPYNVPQITELDEFREGLLYPQSLAAMVTSRVLDPQPNDLVVDMNCAPGGKLSHLSQRMQNQGQIMGFDRNIDKLNQARETARRLGCTNAVLAIRDSRYLHEDYPNLSADRVLIDPPCSAIGIRPKIYDLTSKQRIENLADYQKQFVKSASKIVKPGGVVVYSVCTITKQECEEVVDFAESECGLTLVKQDPFLGSPGLPGYGSKSSLCQRFHPHQHEIGYFVAKFVR